MEQLFDGIKIIDFSSNIAGPVGTSILGDFGAEVIKIERPVIGEDTRMVTPKLEGYALTSWWLNRGKKSVTIDLKDPEGIEILKKIIPSMDVLVESFRPGMMKKFGIDYDSIKKINPSIIYVSVSMYGQTGPLSSKPGFDMLAQAKSGLLDVTGFKNEAPVKSGFYISDYIASVYIYGAISSALFYKEKTGKGQFIDISLLDAIFSANSNFEMGALDMFPTRLGNHAHTVAPYGVFKGNNDQYIVICAQYDNMWSRLCNLMNKPELIADERFESARARVENLDSLVNVIELWLQTFDDIRIPLEKMDEAGIPCSLVYTTKDIRTDEHLLERGMIVDFETPNNIKSFDSILSRGVVVKMSETPGSIHKAPGIGEHNYEILTRYGISSEDVYKIQSKWENEYYNNRG